MLKALGSVDAAGALRVLGFVGIMAFGRPAMVPTTAEALHFAASDWLGWTRALRPKKASDLADGMSSRPTGHLHLPQHLKSAACGANVTLLNQHVQQLLVTLLFLAGITDEHVSRAGKLSFPLANESSRRSDLSANASPTLIREGRVFAADIVGYLFGYFVDSIDSEVRSS